MWTDTQFCASAQETNVNTAYKSEHFDFQFKFMKVTTYMYKVLLIMFNRSQNK